MNEKALLKPAAPVAASIVPLKWGRMVRKRFKLVYHISYHCLSFPPKIHISSVSYVFWHRGSCLACRNEGLGQYGRGWTSLATDVGEEGCRQSRRFITNISMHDVYILLYFCSQRYTNDRLHQIRHRSLQISLDSTSSVLCSEHVEMRQSSEFLAAFLQRR